MATPLEISAAYARLTLQSKLLPVDALLRGTGVTADFLQSADYIDWRKLAAIFHNIDHQQGVSPAWAASLGRPELRGSHQARTTGGAGLTGPEEGIAAQALASLRLANAAPAGRWQ